MNKPADFNHLLEHASRLFPDAIIDVIHDDETIHIDVNGHRYSFEIGSDDDQYIFTDGLNQFPIPLFLAGTEDFS